MEDRYIIVFLHVSASKDNSPPLYEIPFDEDFLGCLKLRCSSNRAYRLPSSCLLSISHGKRLEESKGRKSHRSYAQSGSSYASAVSNSQYGQPQTHGGNRQGESHSYWYGEPQGQSFTDYPTPRMAYEDHSRNKPPKIGRGSSNGRGRGNRASKVKKIMQRDPPESSPQDKQAPKESSRDELSTAIDPDALSKLSLESKQPTQAVQKSEPTKQTGRDKSRELSPSVAAMFSAHEKQSTSSQEPSTQSAGTVRSAQDKTSNLKKQTVTPCRKKCARVC